MIYRQAAFEETCRTCAKPAPERCARCGDPFCDWHLSTDDRVCEPCEDGYQAALEKERRGATPDWIVAWAILIVIGALVWFLTRIPVLGTGAGIAGLFVWAALRHHEKTRRRRRYLQRDSADLARARRK